MAALTAVMVAAAPKHPQRDVTVYVRENTRVAPEVRAPAFHLADKMFAAIGIRLHRYTGAPPRRTSNRHVAIELTADNPPRAMPGAMGSATPFEGVHIRVFYDRVWSETVSRGVLLAHVLVHEIAHILQGTDQHSESGIMKAVWDHSDHLQMREGPLAFTPQDVELIYRGLDARESDARTVRLQ